jgi:CheY-like chemotaxis protein
MPLGPALASIPILVVDDSQFVRKTIRGMLASSGMLNVATAEDGAEALERCSEFEPAIIVLDWTMPMLNGPEFLKLLRTDSLAPSRDAEIIVVTATPTPELIAEAQRWRVRRSAQAVLPRSLVTAG